HMVKQNDLQHLRNEDLVLSRLSCPFVLLQTAEQLAPVQDMRCGDFFRLQVRWTTSIRRRPNTSPCRMPVNMNVQSTALSAFHPPPPSKPNTARWTAPPSLDPARPPDDESSTSPDSRRGVRLQPRPQKSHSTSCRYFVDTWERDHSDPAFPRT